MTYEITAAVPPLFRAISNEQRKSIQNSLLWTDVGVDLNTANWIECEDANEALALLKRQRGLGCIFVFEKKGTRVGINVIGMLLADKRFSLQLITGDGLYTNRSIKSILNDSDWRVEKSIYYAEGDTATRERMRKQRDARYQSQKDLPDEQQIRQQNQTRYKRHLADKRLEKAKVVAKQLSAIIVEQTSALFAKHFQRAYKENGYTSCNRLGTNIMDVVYDYLQTTFGTYIAFDSISAICRMNNTPTIIDTIMINKLARLDVKKFERDFVAQVDRKLSQLV